MKNLVCQISLKIINLRNVSSLELFKREIEDLTRSVI